MNSDQHTKHDFKLPSYDRSFALAVAHKADALERFIVDWEPADFAEQWRDQLGKAIDGQIARLREERRQVEQKLNDALVELERERAKR